MAEEKSGWDKIAEQDEKNKKRENLKNKAETGLDIAGGISGILIVVGLIIIGVVIMILTGTNIFG